MRRYIFLCSTVFLSLLASLNLHAATKQDTAKERALYIQAKNAFSKKEFKKANALTAKLKNYSLYPYLKLQQIQWNISKTPQSKIDAFIKEYVDTPLAKKAQASYLRKLVRSKQWTQYKNNYAKLPLKSATYQCYLAQAQINTGEAKIAMESITSLWNVGHSQPKACDPIFNYWMKKGNPTSDIAFDRAWKAINKKNYTLAKFLQKRVTKNSQKQSLALFWKVKSKPSLITQKNLLSKKTLHNADISGYAIRQHAIKNPSDSLTAWIRDRERFNFTQEKKEYLNTYFGNKFAKRTNFDRNAPATLERIDPNYEYDEVSEWKVRLQLIEQDWKGVIATIQKMPQALQSQNRWRYWLETAKHRASPKTYKAQYQDILKDRDFYSFMAAGLTNSPFELNQKHSTISDEVFSQLRNRPAVKRMSEFFKLGQTSNAYQEWRSLRKVITPEQQLAMGYIVNDWGWYIQGIRIAAKLSAWNQLAIRFPRSQIKLFEELGKERGIGNTWPVAIARQESAYNQFAKSSAGARGFMQLMPATAKITAKKYDIPYKQKADLFDPRTNISLGTAYLAQMMEKFSNKAHSTAAYNAGPHRVERWLKSRGKLPLDIWIETIPYEETRKYVQNVLTYTAIYDLLAGRKARMFTKNEMAQLAINKQ